MRNDAKRIQDVTLGQPLSENFLAPDKSKREQVDLHLEEKMNDGENNRGAANIKESISTRKGL